ncbi:MAG: hypothetical protein KH020_02940 [Clostridiales bacterium]|nr:hypothetical protein [Clostridiales bacterium]
MTVIWYALIFFILYMCVYTLVSRICQCIEHCATARAFSKFEGTDLKGFTGCFKSKDGDE